MLHIIVRRLTSFSPFRQEFAPLFIALQIPRESNLFLYFLFFCCRSVEELLSRVFKSWKPVSLLKSFSFWPSNWPQLSVCFWKNQELRHGRLLARGSFWFSNCLYFQFFYSSSFHFLAAGSRLVMLFQLLKMDIFQNRKTFQEVFFFLF